MVGAQASPGGLWPVGWIWKEHGAPPTPEPQPGGAGGWAGCSAFPPAAQHLSAGLWASECGTAARTCPGEDPHSDLRSAGRQVPDPRCIN